MFDAVDQMREVRTRFYYIGNQHGQPVSQYVCFICGDKTKNGNNVCLDCNTMFPTKAKSAIRLKKDR